MAAATAPDSEGVYRSAIIATLPRSGSWLLAEGLEDTGLCGIPREYFREDYEDIYRREWGVPSDVTHREYVSAVVEAGTTPNGTFAVKLHWGQFARLLCLHRTNPALVDTTASGVIRSVFPNPRYVYLTRRNKPRQAISLYRAILLDAWWAFGDDETTRAEEALRDRRPDFATIAALEADLLRDDMRWMNFFETNRLRPHPLTFEDLTSAYQRAVADVVSHVHDISMAGLSVPPPRLRRQADALSEAWLQEYLASGHTSRLRATRAQYLDRARAFEAEVRRR
jgi:LPS sulfotransferase NodH